MRMTSRGLSFTYVNIFKQLLMWVLSMSSKPVCLKLLVALNHRQAVNFPTTWKQNSPDAPWHFQSIETGKIQSDHRLYSGSEIITEKKLLGLIIYDFYFFNNKADFLMFKMFEKWIVKKWTGSRQKLLKVLVSIIKSKVDSIQIQGLVALWK